MKIIELHRQHFFLIELTGIVNPDGTITCGKHNELKDNHSLYNQLVISDGIIDDDYEKGKKVGK
ncbi:hypothetical protein MKX79_13475 [Viridibacillus sp. FSL R5-0468]|uniref:hypothetical protein n=1 Tax=Viridibacillus sp. FSL R5-0468 TaxID=2921640 RepID=UPI0030FB46DE